MKHPLFRLNILLTGSTLMLLLTTCRKTDHWPHYHCADTTCSAQLMQVVGRDLHFADTIYPKHYKFYKTYGADGRVNYIDAYIGRNYETKRHWEGTVHYTANSVCLLNKKNDTLMVANLNEKGQPTMVWLLEGGWSTTRPPYYTEYNYYENGWFAGNSSIIYGYDQYGNVTSIRTNIPDDPEPQSIDYTYDYSKPIKGGFYEQGVPAGMGEDLLGFLDLINTQPHHLLKRTSSDFYGASGSWKYENQVINQDSYLVYYEADIYGLKQFGVKVNIDWNCCRGRITDTGHGHIKN
ncbi:MAG TPA: hypothetical protein VFS25_06795 [Chitinophaga sp.]|uniref:hypothetical protein n=1 Tax=Chitinophaga sp. TaxID=1869181 RepID=UPI002DB811DC|nr:hypothetical protein [Chitinophaga sp.]HEU4552520.1 hypothetical protein [Chitinophaga sp.]